MDKGLSKLSRWLIVAGIGDILFGGIILLWPGISLEALTIVFGAFALVYGVSAIGGGLNLLAHKSTDWVPFVIGGLGGVIVGIITFVQPGVTALSLTYLIAAWAFIAGVSMILGAIDMWNTIDGMGWLALTGALSIVFGVTVAVQPQAGILAILWVVATYAIIGGVTQLVAAWRINQFRGDVKKVVGAVQPSRP
jgi:uncharacterized membrane protein HdeD (DUF308 family)